MTIGLLTASYITSSVLFILALGGLSNQEKAKRAVWYGIIGMVIAVFATIFGNQVFSQVPIVEKDHLSCTTLVTVFLGH